MGDTILANQETILGLLADFGSQQYSEIRYECLTQNASGDNSIDIALQLLLNSGLVKRKIVEPEIEGDDAYYSYDLAENSIN